LILLFMIAKAGLIVGVFMHMAWERLALMYAILVPPVLVLVFVGIMVFESNYTLFTRLLFFGAGAQLLWGDLSGRRDNDLYGGTHRDQPKARRSAQDQARTSKPGKSAKD